MPACRGSLGVFDDVIPCWPAVFPIEAGIFEDLASNEAMVSLLVGMP